MNTHLAGAQNRILGFEIMDNKKKVIIPFELYNNLIVIPVVLNNAVPLKFVVDTGVPTAILTERTFIDILNISYDRNITVTGADGVTKIEAFVANDVSLRLPGVKGSGQAILVLKKDYLKLSNSMGTPVHGILGYELFSRFIVNIDYANRQLILHEPYYFKPKKSFEEFKINVIDTKPYIVGKLALEGGTVISINLMIDTGASHSLLINTDAHEEIKMPEKRIERNLGRGLGGNIHGFIGRLPAFSLGEFCFEDLIVSFPDEVSWRDYFEKKGRHGTIGGEILTRLNVFFDYFNEHLYLKKNKYYKKDFEYDMSGLELITTGPQLEQIVVQSIVEGSNAEKAGVNVGDTIVMVNNRHVDDFGITEITKLFRTREDRKVKLVIQRDGELVKKEFRLERQL